MTDAPVLVVEDDDDVRSLLLSQLERLGHRVVGAATGRAALALANDERPLVVLLDIGLPDVDGWYVLEQLRAAPVTADVPVVVVSVLDDDGRHAVVEGYVTKPFRAADIVAVIGQVLNPSTPGPTDDGREGNSEPSAGG